MSWQAIFYALLAVTVVMGARFYLAARRGDRDSSPVESGLPPRPTSARGFRNLGLGLGIVAFCALLALFAPWCNDWHWSHHPPSEEHRRELLDITSRQFQCPIHQLVVFPEGRIGARVTGCGANTHLCWRQPARLWKYAWLPCE